MTLRIMNSRGARDVTILIDSANGTIAPGNASINTTAQETVTGLSIRSIIAGVGTGGMVTVQRGANVVFQTAVSGVYDFATAGQAINIDQAANVTVNFAGANCTAQLLCAKMGSVIANSSY